MPQIEKTVAEFIDDRDLFEVSPDDPVSVALDQMKAGTDAVVVTEQGKLVGIFTQRDFLNRVTALQHDAASMRVGQVMTRDPVTMHETDCITYAINHMATNGFRNIPIVDSDGAVRAVLTSRDVVSHLSDLFSELEVVETDGWDEWTDTGGGA